MRWNGIQVARLGDRSSEVISHRERKSFCCSLSLPLLARQGNCAQSVSYLKRDGKEEIPKAFPETWLEEMLAGVISGCLEDRAKALSLVLKSHPPPHPHHSWETQLRGDVPSKFSLISSPTEAPSHKPNHPRRHPGLHLRRPLTPSAP